MKEDVDVRVEVQMRQLKCALQGYGKWCPNLPFSCIASVEDKV